MSKLISHEYLQILFSQGLVNFNDNNNYMVTFYLILTPNHCISSLAPYSTPQWLGVYGTCGK